MENVVLEVIHKPSTQPEEVRTILGDLPVGRQIKTKMNGSDQIETALVRYRIDGMENTFSCGPVAAGESLIMTNDNKGVTCDFQ
jgi:hypothetical protein